MNFNRKQIVLWWNSVAYLDLFRTGNRPVGWVHLGGGAADLQEGPIFFPNTEKQESRGDQHFSRGAAPVGPPTLRGCLEVTN